MSYQFYISRKQVVDAFLCATVDCRIQGLPWRSALTGENANHVRTARFSSCKDRILSLKRCAQCQQFLRHFWQSPRRDIAQCRSSFNVR